MPIPCGALSHSLTLTIDHDGLTVADFYLGTKGELQNASVGKHPLYGDIAIFYSVRGPGEGARPRPAFFIYTGGDDGEVDFIEDGATPTGEPDFVDLKSAERATTLDECNAKLNRLAMRGAA